MICSYLTRVEFYEEYQSHRNLSDNLNTGCIILTETPKKTKAIYTGIIAIRPNPLLRTRRTGKSWDLSKRVIYIKIFVREEGLHCSACKKIEFQTEKGAPIKWNCPSNTPFFKLLTKPVDCLSICLPAYQSFLRRWNLQKALVWTRHGLGFLPIETIPDGNREEMGSTLNMFAILSVKRSIGTITDRTNVALSEMILKAKHTCRAVLL